MLWFKNAIHEAIQHINEQNKVLLVLVAGPDRQRTDLLRNCVEDLNVEKFPNLISVSLEHNSQNFLHFIQCYTNLEFPSVVFIGRKGVPIKVVHCSTSTDRDETFSKVQEAARYCNRIGASNENKENSENLNEPSPESKEKVQTGTSSSNANVLQNPTEKPAEVDLQTRIQFKMPDGSSRNQMFKSTDTIRVLRKYVEEHCQPRYRYDLATMHPTRVLPLDSVETLVELDLHPSAVILIVPMRNAQSVTSFNYITDLFWSFMYPFVNVYSYISNLVFPSTRGSPAERSTAQPQSSRRLNNQFGNVHTLTSRRDRNNDEDRTTWNGNSTQQM